MNRPLFTTIIIILVDLWLTVNDRGGEHQRFMMVQKQPMTYQG